MRALTQWRFDRPLLPMAAVGMALVGGVWIAWLISEGSWRTLALLCVMGILPLALRWPVTLTFGAYAFVLPFSHVALFADSGGVSGARLIGIVAIGAFAAAGLVQKRLVKPPAPALWAIALVLWAITTLFWSVSPEEALISLPTILSILALYLAAVCFRVSERELRIVCLLAMIGGLLAVMAGVLSGFEADASHADVRSRMTVAGQEGNPNAVASGLLLPMGMAIGLLFSSRAVLGRAIAVTAIVAIGAGIFLTVSRANLLALTIMLCVLLVRSRKRWHLVAVVGVLAGLLLFMPDILFQRIDMLISGEDTTGSGRTDIWTSGLALLSRFGWFGSGLQTWSIVYMAYGSGIKYRGSHNSYLMVWVELGVVGLALLLMMIFAHLRLAWRTSGRTSEGGFPVAIEAACCAVLVALFFSDDLWAKNTWLSLILAVWASRNSLLGTSRSRSTRAELAGESLDNVGEDPGHAATRH